MVRKCGIRELSVSGRLLTLAVAMLALTAAPAFGQIHQLLYNNVQWTDTDITAAGGGAPVGPQLMTAFYTTPNNQLHVFYVSDNQLHQLYYNGSNWSDANLTAQIGGQDPANESGMSGFSIGNAQYVYFCGSDGAVHEYSYGDQGNFNWVDRALPKGRGKGCGVALYGLTAFLTANNQRHVFYQAPNSNKFCTIHHLVFNGSAWADQNLTSLAKGAKGPDISMNISGFAIGNAMYIFFWAANAHIHEFSFENNKWKDLDLTAAVGANPAEYPGPHAFLVPGTTQMEVFYAGALADIHEIKFVNNQWTDTDVTALAGGSADGPYLFGFATSPDNQLHVYVEGKNSAVDQLNFNGTSWTDQVLPSAPTTSGEVMGFPIGTQQYVYYVSPN